jgi:predicted CoA-binding protein
MNEDIRSFIESKTVAVVGASSRRFKFGNAVYRTLKKRGYQVFAVNPNAENVDGDRCYPNLLLLPDDVDAAVVVTRPENAFGLVEKATQKGIRRLWFQQGADYSMLAEQARQAGMQVVTGKCILMYSPPVTGLHSVHRWFAGALGKL